MQCVALKLIVAMHIKKDYQDMHDQHKNQNSTFRTIQNPYEGADKQATR